MTFCPPCGNLAEFNTFSLEQCFSIWGKWDSQKMNAMSRHGLIVREEVNVGRSQRCG